MGRDVFFCHASEDKKGIVFPLANAFNDARISYWVDEGEIFWGDSITQKVNEGLQISHFVMVVLSEAFLNKKWPQRELYSALNIEASTGEVKVLPLLVGGQEIRLRFSQEYPLLNDKLFMVWNGNTQPITDAMLARLSRTHKVNSSNSSKTSNSSAAEIPLPMIRKKFSQRQKDLFLKNSFTVIKNYFERALSLLENQNSGFETDFTEIHAQKFVAKIYFQGELKKQCKIWIGGLSASNAIAYSEDRLNTDADNSYNEIINIEDDGFDIYLRFSIGMFQQESQGHFDPSKAAEALWRRFSSKLG